MLGLWLKCFIFIYINLNVLLYLFSKFVRKIISEVMSLLLINKYFIDFNSDY